MQGEPAGSPILLQSGGLRSFGFSAAVMDRCILSSLDVKLDRSRHAR
jgi:hypothetical protein